MGLISDPTLRRLRAPFRIAQSWTSRLARDECHAAHGLRDSNCRRRRTGIARTDAWTPKSGSIAMPEDRLQGIPMSHDKICAKLEFLCSCAWLRRAYAIAQGAVIFEDSTMSLLDQLNEMRRFGGAIRTHGLADAQVTQLAAKYPELVEAIAEASVSHRSLRTEMPELLALDENAQLARVQGDFINFYPEDAINPYVALAARGPWVVTLKGAVIHDSGGYGMLGFGHTPKAILAALGTAQVMANVMTPNVSQLRFTRALQREIGHSRGGSPFKHFLCLNSGSEAVSLACRIADVNAKLMTEPGARHAGRTIKRVAVKGAFHGRTERPALYSDSSRKAYVQHLASFRDERSVLTVEPYNIDQLRQIFADADKNGWFIEAMFLEPVMGEGDPGRAATPEFYAAARELTRSHGALFLVDSIQAGLRAHGVLSIVDYPGFETLDPPDMETYSKAINGGQYPLSVLAVSDHAGALYKKGIYGNTMSSNPRALDVACAALAQLTPELRTNIRRRGAEFVERLNRLKAELPGLITKVQGTGLLFSCELAPQFKCYGAGSTEEWMRERGFGVIHGGTNSLRFTPHFAITSDEVDLLLDGVRQALLHGPRMSEPAPTAAAA
jgi:acetylornithine/succinyldiaminopimelate/putrescine aminotransferase